VLDQQADSLKASFGDFPRVLANKLRPITAERAALASRRDGLGCPR
jgi:hypothetical protein